MKDLAKKLDEMNRRDFLSRVAQASLGVTILPASNLLGAGTRTLIKADNAPCQNLIFLYMSGGMSHVDTFDPKTSDVRGMISPLATNADGVQLSDKLPRLAKHGKKLTLLRSVTTKTGAHEAASYLMHTGYSFRPGTSHPQMGSWAQYFLGSRKPGLPDSVLVNAGNPGPGFFDADHSPLPIGDPNKGIKDLLPKIKPELFAHRMKLAQEFAHRFQREFPHKDVKAYSNFYDQTVKFFDGESVAAFDLDKEPKALRDTYGRSRFGQGCLLARRLIENGVRYIEVGFGRSWDSMHNSMDSMLGHCNELDSVLPTLLDDLESRGMLKNTMVVVATEFGRSPKINDLGGRDHHPAAFSCAMAGGGVKGGFVYGKTDDRAMKVVENPINVKDIHTTIAKAMGLPIDKRIHGSGGLPFFVGNQGKVLPVLA